MKKLTLVVVLAIATFAQAGPPERHIKEDYTSFDTACNKLKHPTDWLCFSADLRLREIYRAS
ncbi:MAG: hypothetical protein HN370_02730 [Phycisphaerales bacterium]|jgi:hypothetical protein|nr:hypothetical protein [Phycisphaerales bacterium]